MRLLLPTLLGAIAPGLTAQTQVWRPLASPALPLASAWDSTRQCTALVGAARMWEWDGATLRERLSALQGVSDVRWLADDPLHHRLVALAGYPPRVGTWDGAQWSWQATAPSAPTFYSTTLVAFDEARSRIVVYEPSVMSTGMHEWDGTQWSSVPGSPTPVHRWGAAFAYDAVGQRCVVYGGNDLNPLGDFWGWDGSNWTLIDGNAAPGVRSEASMAFSPALGCLLLHGGGATTTWCLAGNTWVQLPTAHDPGPTYGAMMVQDPLGMVLIDPSAPALAEAWRFAGGDWARVDALDLLTPPPQYGHTATTVAFDRARGQMVVHNYDGNGSLKVVLFDSRWHGTQPTVSPWLGAMCWSSIEQQVLLFGGSGGAETWNWTGTDWVQRTPPQAPPPRDGAVLVEDPNGGVMLFGGRNGAAVYGDQWHWNGASWTPMTPAMLPPPRDAAQAALDEPRQTVVMVGGSAVGVGDTWQWDGTNWTQAQPTLAAVGRVAFDPRLGQVIAYGSSLLAWSGTDWVALPTTPPSSAIGVLVTDHARQRVLGLLHPPYQQYLIQELTDLPSSAVTFGNGCALGATPALHAMSDPTPGNAAFAIDVGTLAPSAPTFLLLGLGAQNVPLGAGCALLVAQPVATLFAMAPPSGQFRHAIPIPNTAGLRGVQFVAQGAVFDPPRSALGSVTITAGLRITIGD